KKGILDNIAESAPTAEMHPLAELMKLKQCTTSLALLKMEVPDKDRSIKVNTLKEYLEDICETDKVVVFTQFKTMVNELLKDPEIMKYNPAVITGDVNSQTGKTGISDRQVAVNKFQEDDSCRLFIGTTGACKEGLNLTAGSYMFFLDMEWNNDGQAEDRIYRIGQNKTAYIYYLVCKDTIDEVIYQVTIEKQQMFNSLIDGKGTGASMKTMLKNILEVG
ncbi:MAG: C-terminal helicase domain-containing protein, partial [bacterium]